MYLKTLYHFYTPLFRPGRSPRELAHFIADASKFRQASMLAAENARNKLKTVFRNFAKWRERKK